MDNESIAKALRSIKETRWVGSLTFHRLDEALVSINFSSNNGGLHHLPSTRLKGVKGIFLVNKDGSIFWEGRVIKKTDDRFLVEWLSNDGYDDFEATYKKIEEERCDFLK